MDQGTDGVAGPGDPAAPAGWYPVDGGLQRYWDGRVWTEHTAPAPGSPSPAPAGPPSDQTASIPGPGAAPGSQPAAPVDAPTPWIDGSPASQNQGAQNPSLQNPGFQNTGLQNPGFHNTGFQNPVPQPLAAAPIEPQPFNPVPQQPVPAAGPYGQPVAPGAVSADDKSMALLAHLLTLVVGFLGPLIVWLTKRDQSPFIDHHGKEALNFQFSMFIYWIGALVAMIILIGFLLIPVLLVLQILFPILAGIAANRGEYYRYPLTIRFIR